MHSKAFVFAIVAVGLSNCLSVEKTKAASPLTNCGCQCSSLTFRDSAGVVQGNCNTVDSTGAQWCYVDSAHSSCQDLVPSQRFPHNPWSYEACATPSIGSSLCPAYHAPVVVVADHDDHHDDDHAHIIHAPLIVAPVVPSHVHVAGAHNTEIPQGLNPPIPKTAEQTAAPTK